MFYLYKTTNLMNGMIYVGVSGKDLENEPTTPYLGSGDSLCTAIRMYGRPNFCRKIIHKSDNPTLICLLEKEIVNKDFVKDINTYNIQCGGTSLSSLRHER